MILWRDARMPSISGKIQMKITNHQKKRAKNNQMVSLRAHVTRFTKPAPGTNAGTDLSA
jgi:hypothetical protein